MKIKTNNVPRWLVSGMDMPEKSRADFDYLSDEEMISERFFQYRGAWYDVGEFTRVQLRGANGFNPMCYTAYPGEPIASWDAIQTDSYFSATVVKLVSDDRVIVGRMYS